MSRSEVRAAVSVAVSIACMCIARDARSQAIFTEITSSAGVAGSDSGGHGLGLGDVNNDGLIDMYVHNSVDDALIPGNLFLNVGNNEFADIAEARNVDDTEYIGGHGAIFIDIDRDQDLDLYLANMGMGSADPERNTLFRNDGDLNFTDISVSSGIGAEYTATRGVAGMDVDRDGDLDLISSPFGDPITLYLNNGSGFFTAAVRGCEDDTLPKQGIEVMDIEGDGDPDLYVNKWGKSPNRLFRNNGSGFFVERAESLGINTSLSNNNGGTFADIDNDGDLDLFVMNRGSGNIYVQIFRNQNGHYVNETNTHQIPGNGFSVAAGDVDNDGDLDIFVARSFFAFTLWMNNGSGSFTQRVGSGVEVTGADTRSASFVDIDNDGDLDLMVVSKDMPCHLFRNDTNNSSFIEIRLIGPTGEKYGMGTRAYLYEAGHGGDEAYFKGYRQISSSMGYLCQPNPVIHFGLAEEIAHDVLLSFPTGEELLLPNVAPGQILDVDARNWPPQGFALLSPSLGEVVSSPSVVLDWEDAFDPNPWDSVLYDLAYGTSAIFDPDSTFFVDGLAASEYEIATSSILAALGNPGGKDGERTRRPDLLVWDDTMIYWKVEAFDTRTARTPCMPAASHFWISKPEAPGPFALAIPVDGDTIDLGEAAQFVWHRSFDPDPYDSLLTYHIQAGLDTAFSQVLWTGSVYGDTVFVAEPFEEELTFYWNVTAEGKDGLSVASSSIFMCLVRQSSRVQDDVAGAGSLPKAISISQNYPNPFNPVTSLRIEVPPASGGGARAIEFCIYSLRGGLVRRLYDGLMEPGVHLFVWEGRDDRGRKVPSGVYLAVLRCGSETETVKMLLGK
jgi:hypothetical protein